jgi:hypothetical protein
MQVITLTTDFGDGSPYVAAMKGAVLAVNPDARLIDLGHAIGPQDLRHASFFLRAAVPYYPAGTIHVIVVDPGVGTERALLYVEVAGQRLLVPDNGCWSELARGASVPPVVHRLAEPRYWRPHVSATFHGRDILAPVAGHLSLGLDYRLLGPALSQWVELPAPAPLLATDQLRGEVVFVDPFGNLITNIPGEAYRWWQDRLAAVVVGEQAVDRRVRTYGEAPPGTLVALLSSVDTLEIAVTQGSAAARLGAGVGTAVRVTAPSG